jgi:hypothetical protein
MKTLPGVKSAALFSESQMFRYWLTRTWDETLPTVAFIGLNPSVADLERDDNTVRKCQQFARNWGYGRLLMLNIYAYRATDPRNMWRAMDKYVDIIGGARNSFASLQKYIADFNATRTVAAWGRQAHGRGSDAYKVIPNLYCLRTKMVHLNTRCTSLTIRHSNRGISAQTELEPHDKADEKTEDYRRTSTA